MKSDTRTSGQVSRVWVVGLDGATFDLLIPLMDAGLLPNLARIRAEGAWGPLQSTTPPVTAPAWASFMTGVNPGKHGVFDFTVHTEHGLSWANSRAIRSPTLWRILSRHGRRVGVVNVPVTYPAEPVNGYLIPGFLTPKNAAQFTYPPQLYDELASAVGKYTINVKIAGREKGDEAAVRALVTEIQDAVAAREAALHYLMDNYPTDFLMIVWMSLDKIQHVFWKYLDPGSDLYHTPEGARRRELVLPCYEQIDDAIGRLLARADDRTTLLLMSDHGFGTLEKQVDLNRWLAARGLFRLRKGQVLLREVRRRLGIQNQALPPLHGGVAADVSKMACIDWDHTHAYCGEISGQGIFVNLRGREPYGIVEPGQHYESVRDRIVEELSNWREPGTDHPIVDRVYKREELYTGPHVGNAPDLLVTMRDYSYLLINSVRFAGRGYLRAVDDASGFHRPQGILMAWGQQVIPGHQIKQARIIDLAPTILHLMDLPVSQSMDGQVLNAIWVEDSEAARPVVYGQESDVAVEHMEAVYTAEEAEEVRGRLSDLGYL